MAAPAARRARRWALALFLLFVLGYDVFRVALFAMTQNGSVKPDHPLDPLTNSIVVYSELAIGLVGLFAFPGLVWPRRWGFWATAAVSAYAIIFDAVSAVVVQPSAAGGVIPPVLILLLLVALRHRYLPAKPSAAMPSATQA